MSILSDIGGRSISEMSSEEIQEMLINIRRNRRAPENKPKHREPAKKEIKKLNMSKEEAAELLKQLLEA